MLMLALLLVYFLLGLISVAYLTLHERHVLAMTQHRLGPSKVGYSGVLQPFSDALKLLQKEVITPFYSMSVYYFMSPMLMFLLWFLYWALALPSCPLVSVESSGLLLLCLVGSSVYTLFFMGLSSKSKYSYLGAMRSTTQSLTFEVSFFFLVLSYFFVVQGLELQSFSSVYQLPLAYLWLMHLVVELGRAPVDFPESESETVSGYNLEYGGVLFIFIFLSEYGFLLFFSVLFSQVFLSWGGSLSFYLVVTFVILLRSALPRYRYDYLLNVFWGVLLPVSMQFMLFYFLLVKVLI